MTPSSIRPNLILAILALAGAAPLAEAQAATPASTDSSAGNMTQNAEDIGISLSTGFDYATGKYGMRAKTETYTGNLTGKYDYQDWTARVYLPYESLTSPGGLIIINGRPVLTQGASNNKALLQELGLTAAQYKALTVKQRRALINNLAKENTNSGIGDAELSGDYDAYHDKTTGWDISFTGAVKLATGSTSEGLGTGETDFSFSTDISRKIGKFTPAVSFGYRLVGKPSDSDLRNYFFASVGGSYSLTDSTDVSLTFSTTERSSASASVDNEVSFGVSQDFGKSWNLDVHALIGLSAYAPDLGAGVALRCSF